MYKNEIINSTVVVIPSLHPDDKLKSYIKALLNVGIAKIIVVDDGSGAGYSDIFGSLKQNNVVLLTHDVNKGKGVALKTAFAYLENNFQDLKYIITADSDGQHAVNDVCAVATKLYEEPNSLVLGSRDFLQDNVPFKSRAGNRITSFVFKLLYGQHISDTQTGLRGFTRNYLNEMISVKGDRFEYEMNVLIYYSLKKYKIIPQKIETIYNNDNKGSHFRPFRDSIKIYKVIFLNVFKFLSSSVFTTVLDYVLFIVFTALLSKSSFHTVKNILMAGYSARFISSLFNFFINHKFVFNINSKNIKKRIALFKYILTCILIITLSNFLVIIVKKYLRINEVIAKPIVDTCLFFLSYRIQKNWVFAGKVQTEDLDIE